MGVSIADVAARAGVSRTTVSHALSGKRLVGADVRRRVEDAMQELGYVPSRSARSLALGRTQVLGLLVPDITNGFFAELAKGVESTAIEAGYNVILGNTGFDRARELLYLEMIRSRAVDGVLYAAGAAIQSSEIARVLRDVPLVLVDEELDDSAAYAVVSDNVDGGRQAAKHLLDLGHRRALSLGASRDLLSSARRLDGFAHAWRAEGGERLETGVASFTIDGGVAGVEPYVPLFQSGEFTAVFAANDLMAVGVIRRLREAGIRVPDQVSVVGFDDSPVARFIDPALTTVRQDVWGLGARAATVLIEALDTHEPLGRAREVRPVALVQRGTTARPPLPG
ncbi:LacI family DNA-binding transcriptional regulator [Georgenia sp.]